MEIKLSGMIPRLLAVKWVYHLWYHSQNGGTIHRRNEEPRGVWRSGPEWGLKSSVVLTARQSVIHVRSSEGDLGWSLNLRFFCI